MPPKLESKGINLNTVLLVLGLLGAGWTTIKIGGPLVNVPDKVEDVAKRTESIERTQMVQTEALKTLADVAKDGREMRRDFDRHAAESTSRHREHDAELGRVKERLNRLEQR